MPRPFGAWAPVIEHHPEVPSSRYRLSLRNAVYSQTFSNYIYMRSETPHLLPHHLCGGATPAHGRNCQASPTEPVTKEAPEGVVLNVRLTVTVRVVATPPGKVTDLDRTFVARYKKLAAGLPEPEV